MLYYVIDAFAKCKFGVLDSKLSINYMTQFYQFKTLSPSETPPLYPEDYA